MSEQKVLLYVLICAVITYILRLLPFLFSKKSTGNDSSGILSYLSSTLPFAVMGMLVVYCLKDISFSSINGYLPMLIGVLATVLSYLLSKKSVISITVGTVVYMLLVQLVFI